MRSKTIYSILFSLIIAVIATSTYLLFCLFHKHDTKSSLESALVGMILSIGVLLFLIFRYDRIEESSSMTDSDANHEDEQNH